jgi:SAM-dependent methyltransferase
MQICPLCNSADNRRGIENPTRPNELHNTGVVSYMYWICNKCGLQYQQDRLPADYYKKDYRKNLPGNCEFVRDANINNEHRRAIEIDKLLVLWGVVPASVLDVGSSTGELLRLLNQKYGCEVQGVEPSDAFREYANQQGTKTVAKIEDGIWDLVTCAHVLEHQERPLEFLAEVKQRVGRYLFIEVPFLMPNFAHTLMFTFESLERMLEKAGFRVLHKDVDQRVRVLCEPGL